MTTSTPAIARRIEDFTPEQLELLLEKIVSIADTLTRYCAEQNGKHGLAAGDGFHIAGLMAAQIGALADHAVGAGVVGDLAAWMIATDFSDRGQEARHA